MTTIERRKLDLADLIATHRLVRVTMQQAVCACTARVAMPDYGIAAGERFFLAASDTHEGYAYLVREEGLGRTCTCRNFQFRRTCADCQAVNLRTIGRSEDTKNQQDATLMAAQAQERLPRTAADRWADEDYDPFAGMSQSERRAAYRTMYPDDFALLEVA